MKLRSYTDAEIISAFSTSTSFRQVLAKLNLKPAGGNYQTLRNIVKELNLDTSHFKGQGWNSGTTQPPRRSLEDYISNNQPIQSFKLKNRLLKEGIFKYQCFSCLQTTWLSQKIPLELDHIDGNNNNNQLSNLRLLCPNCHALTPNYRGKNIGNYTNA